MSFKQIEKDVFQFMIDNYFDNDVDVFENKLSEFFKTYYPENDTDKMASIIISRSYGFDSVRMAAKIKDIICAKDFINSTSYGNEIVDESLDWVFWGGGDCPLDIGQRVKVRLRNGQTNEGFAGDFIWSHFPPEDNEADIIRYLITD